MVLILFLLAPLLRLILKPILWLLALQLLVHAPGYAWRLLHPGAAEESIHLLNGLLGTPLVLLYLLATLRRLFPRRRGRRRREAQRAWAPPRVRRARPHSMVYPCPHCGGTHHP